MERLRSGALVAAPRALRWAGWYAGALRAAPAGPLAGRSLRLHAVLRGGHGYRQTAPSPPAPPLIAAFTAFLALYAACGGVAEVAVGRAGQDTAFQKLLALQGHRSTGSCWAPRTRCRWPMATFPAATGGDATSPWPCWPRSAPGPLYNRFWSSGRPCATCAEDLLYVVDTFAFTGAALERGRGSATASCCGDAAAPVSTAWPWPGRSARHGADPRGLADYLTGLFQAQPARPVSTGGMARRGDFDRQVRLSRHAVRTGSTISTPNGTGNAVSRYLDVLVNDVRRGPRRGASRSAWSSCRCRPRSGRPARRGGLRRGFPSAPAAAMGIPYHDLSGPDGTAITSTPTT